MATATIFPTEGQLIVSVSDMSMIKDIKKAISMVKGVAKVKQLRRKPRLYDPETGEYLNDKTMKAIEDVRSGKEPVYEMNSMEEFKSWCESL